jgi:hypothetical protein
MRQILTRTACGLLRTSSFQFWDVKATTLELKGLEAETKDKTATSTVAVAIKVVLDRVMMILMVLARYYE